MRPRWAQTRLQVALWKERKPQGHPVVTAAVVPTRAPGALLEPAATVHPGRIAQVGWQPGLPSR